MSENLTTPSIISIHALLAESDTFHVRSFTSKDKFLSTLSLRRATFILQPLCIKQLNFYPRSPCGERRAPAAAGNRWAPYFYPRSPCGERRIKRGYVTEDDLFLSTLSLRRATPAAVF